jgi:hypothetical protein
MRLHETEGRNALNQSPAQSFLYRKPLHERNEPGLSDCFVYLVDLVHLISFIQPNKLNEPNEQEKPAAPRD